MILERLDYGFDRASRRTWRRRALATGEDQAYGYDGLSQVVEVARGNPNLNATAIGGVPAEAQGWDYDPTGNRRGYETKANGSVVLVQARVHDKGNRLSQIVGTPNPVLLDRAGRMREVSPDASGNWNQAQQVKWDAWGRVTEVRRKSDGAVLGNYSYDGLSRRTTQSVGGTTTHTYYSDAWRPLEERRDSQTTAARQYYWGARHRDDLVRRDRATTSGGPLNETRYVLMDYFSPAAIIDATGAVKERYAFSAFGVRRILTPAFGDRATSECDFTFAFQGQFLDTESGFLNYGYRYYSPHLGRWLSKDPVEEFGGKNLYGYVLNNPSNNSDFLGLSGDRYVPDNKKHGSPHVDRYRGNNNIGRYRKDGSGIKTKGELPPSIPRKDLAKFAKAASKLSLRLLGLALSNASLEVFGFDPFDPDNWDPNPEEKDAECNEKCRGVWDCECPEGFSSFEQLTDIKSDGQPSITFFDAEKAA